MDQKSTTHDERSSIFECWGWMKKEKVMMNVVLLLSVVDGEKRKSHDERSSIFKCCGWMEK